MLKITLAALVLCAAPAFASEPAVANVAGSDFPPLSAYEVARKSRQACVPDYILLCEKTEEGGVPTSPPPLRYRGRRQPRSYFPFETCLAEKAAAIKNKTCKRFIDGRAKCHSEAEVVCKDAIAMAGDSKADANRQQRSSFAGAGAAIGLASGLDSREKLVEKAKAACLREQPKERFSSGCTSSDYFIGLSGPSK